MTFIDLFAGIGGMRIAFERVGAKCVFSSEWDKYCQETYLYNFEELPAGDITKIEASDIPPFDVLVAGFPCQPFSGAGLKKGFDDDRGNLFFDIMRIVKHHNPKVVFLENVKNILFHDKGNTFLTIQENLKLAGYNVFHKVLNARDFGLPQNRERLYIVALKDADTFDFPVPFNTPTRLGDILEKYARVKYTISDKLWQGHQRRKSEHLLKGNGFGYKIFNRSSEYTSTLSSRYYKDGSEILIEQKHKNPRKLTPRECARLMGFPETFNIVVSDSQAYKQFGNSVCVPIIKCIANVIKCKV